MQTLQQEIRGAFKSYDQINAASTARLAYLNAVVLEGLRIFPPVPFALPRVVPVGGDIVDGHFVPEGVCHEAAAESVVLISLADNCRH